tara:strand:+ start:245 stop:673 length:429 start_codon:yes stop_codon:yes gene_type:complete
MTKNKVKSVQGNGTYKDMFIFEITLENGDVGNIYRKTDDAKVEVGQEIEYDLKPSGTIKIITDYNREEFIKKTTTISNPNKDNVQLMIVKQSCLKCAVEMDKSGDRSKIVDDAQYFVDWVTDNCCSKNESKNNNDERQNIPF